MKILTCGQIKSIDKYTIENEPVRSIDLMERAAGKIFEWLVRHYPRSCEFIVFVGPGNNGGDGLAVVRKLLESGYSARAVYMKSEIHESEDWKTNRMRLEKLGSDAMNIISSPDELPHFGSRPVIIDSIFGSGLSKPSSGNYADLIDRINHSDCDIIAIDIPSGLFCEDNSANTGSIIRADITLTLQFPKLAFMFPGNDSYVGDFHVLPIGLHPNAINNTATPYYFLETSDIGPLLRKRSKYDHKGMFGHGLLVAGSYGKAGAAILGARAALRSGIGLLSCRTPASCCQALQAAVPEAMVVPDKNAENVTSVEISEGYAAIAAGPGLGVSVGTGEVLKSIIQGSSIPLVLDADALNLLGLNRDWMSLLPSLTILTPHPREFERLTGKKSENFERLEYQREFSARYNCIIILKGAHTSVSLPDGRVYFNSTGNPGMATAGSGDVLTGIILSLLSQGYAPEDAARAGVFIHGLAGDIAAETKPFEAIIASDIIESIGNAYLKIREQTVIY